MGWHPPPTTAGGSDCVRVLMLPRADMGSLGKEKDVFPLPRNEPRFLWCPASNPDSGSCFTSLRITKQPTNNPHADASDIYITTPNYKNKLSITVNSIQAHIEPVLLHFTFLQSPSALAGPMKLTVAQLLRKCSALHITFCTNVGPWTQPQTNHKQCSLPC